MSIVRLASTRRDQVADGLERALLEAEAPTRSHSSAAPISRAEVQWAQEALAQLIDELRSGQPVDPCGVTRARQLLTDAGSPLYAPVREGDLLVAIEQARVALEAA